MIIEVVRRLHDLIAAGTSPTACGVTPARLLSLIDEALGDDLHRYPDGRMLIWDIARHDGYRIPDYPMAGCGDVKEFLADEGARNVPDWYRVHLGLERAVYDEIWRYQLVMVRNRALWRRVFLVPADDMATEDADRLARTVFPWLAFALGRATTSDNPTLFQR